MSHIVLDASITLSWCFPDEQSALSMQVLDRLTAGDEAVVPFFWSLEVLNSLLVGERRGRIAPAQTAAFLDMLSALNPIIDYAPLERINGTIQELCRTHGLTPYDALYVELALRGKCPLATHDETQKKIASALGVECI